ncbi:MAG TPA: hypothetical protein VFE46_13200 [Pirellulales bacterium]|jgi:hypothetical protein|nr:hypothetical protein [Pirellulales bacterium]
MSKTIETESSAIEKAAGRHPRYHWPVVLAVLWSVAVAAGLCFLAVYSATPGSASDPPKNWPAQAGLELNPQGATLVMFVHPHCPCTRASLSELERMLRNCERPVSVWIVFYKPTEMPDNWEQSDLWRSASALPGAHVISDPDGAVANGFHIFTSGQTLLYDAHGKLLFSGGITGARGHEGDNAGETAIQEFVNHGDSGCRQTPVFGCPIINSGTSP